MQNPKSFLMTVLMCETMISFYPLLGMPYSDQAINYGKGSLSRRKDIQFLIPEGPNGPVMKYGW